MGGVSSQESDSERKQSDLSFDGFMEAVLLLPMIKKAKRDLVILVVFFGHFGMLRSAPGVTDK